MSDVPVVSGGRLLIDHRCAPPLTLDLLREEIPVGSVFACDCGTTWVLCGMATRNDVITQLDWTNAYPPRRMKREV